MMKLLPLVVLATGCAPTLVAGSMANPARRTDKIESTQTYEIGPYKENHQYELTLSAFTASSIGLAIKITEVDRCASPKNYTYTLVDDHSVHTSLMPSNDPVSTSQPGRAGKPVTVSRWSGTFAATVVPDTQSLTVQMRPLVGSCPSLDFKWALN
ncbi:MAG: hypothetical protein ABI321_17670 [Polyangia bacterium]